MISAGESVLGMFMGKRSTRSATTTMKKYQKSKDISAEIERVNKDINSLNREMEYLENELKLQIDSIKQKEKRRQPKLKK